MQRTKLQTSDTFLALWNIPQCSFLRFSKNEKEIKSHLLSLYVSEKYITQIV